MTDNEKEEVRERFNDDVQWLRDNIAPDDIYEFAEQALMAADYFLYQLSAVKDVGDLAEESPIFAIWLNNIVGLRSLREMQFKCKINLNLVTEDEL